MTSSRPNRLAGEASPYLLQHAHNPVDWFPWGEEALERARTQEKPIFLSVGYAACHWCHVMERESFEDDATAALMNEHFVSIKVDREERPDVDSIYMDAVQAMTGRGGWPMSAFLTPEGRPFYAGTYFPKEPAHGMPSFRQVLTGIAQAWRDKRDEIDDQAERVTETMARAGLTERSIEPLDGDIARQALGVLRGSFDPKWGGFGGAPKFPQPMVLEFVLRRAIRGDSTALEMLTVTLEKMAEGGIYDQLGGGFSRYSTDATWHVPHFEKMLYDNAQLARLYARAWHVTRNESFRRIASETLDYLLREMQHPEGGFWSSQDADSEGIEGKYFSWTWPELVGLVGETVATAFGAVPGGNWDGTNVLWRPLTVAAVAAESGRTPEELEAEIADARSLLFEERQNRIRPATDDKILTAWNALAIHALVEGGRAFDAPAYIEAAVRCAEFLLMHLRDERGRLLRSWRNGVASVPGFADDYALMAAACLALYETTFELRWFEQARGLADELLRLFRDEERGGFFQTGADATPLVIRPKELYDNAVPSGNSVAADVLQRLALLTGDDTYERAAVDALRLVRDQMRLAPTGFGTALCALDLYLGPSREVAVIGDPDDATTRTLATEVTTARYLPNVVLAVAAPDDEASRSAVALLADRVALEGRATAYVCERFACKLPVTTPEALSEQLIG
ncbi:MAG: thioredoxin domain-containing protein [Actinomycetota bacterium]|nr:thioredoxin domain-containing protein [Actinomycetota bacterium]